MGLHDELVEQLFEAALALEPSERSQFLRRACEHTPELLPLVEELLNADRAAGSFLAEPLLRANAQCGEEPTAASGGCGPQDSRFRPDEVILGRFRIVRLIGRGGMGEVYEAEDLELGRIALKTIQGEIAFPTEAFKRFRQEVQLARKVTGSQVCRIYELYLLPASGNHSATAFLTMEYLDGIALSAKLKKDGPLHLKDALRVALDICEGLRLVHAKGVIHRDLKSSNIMLCGQSASLRAVLMDFGLARAFDTEPSSSVNEAIAERHMGTATGAIMGTPAYMAPEQFEGKPVSPATDIYALGVVLYELVTGLHPFAAPTPVAAAIRRAHHPALPSSLNRAVPRKWDRVIHQCLQYEPADRFQSVEEVAKVLCAGPANLGNLRKDRPWLFRIACASILAVLAWGIFLRWRTAQYYHPNAEVLNRYNNGLALIRQGNYAEATRLLEESLKADGYFVMAHARLAEALYNLDFQGNAQRELLIALTGRNRLTPRDQMYLDAIHATVAGDSYGAIKDYTRIRDQLPNSDKSSGYVDLGMAYERAGDVSQALEMYSQAASLNSKNPAAYMHTGILQSRLHHLDEGNRAFDSAQAIFTTELDSYGNAGNPEGLAELDYERGYALNVSGRPKDAKLFLERSLEEARKIPSVQLEIRTLCQLSSAEATLTLNSQAVDHAEQAIRLARDNQLESWAANALVRLANARLLDGHLKESEEQLQEAMQNLRQSPQPRVEASANSTLASLMNLEHSPEKVIGPARAAYEFYEKNGFLEGAYKAKLLLIRAERDRGQYQQALTDSKELVNLAGKSGNGGLQIQAEETEGTIYFKMEQYPSALVHFLRAKEFVDSDTSSTGKILRPYEAADCGYALWRLGLYPESEAMFELASGTAALAADITENRIESKLSQRQYRAALAEARKEIAALPQDMTETKFALEQDALIAEASLGRKKQVLAELSVLAALDDHKGNPEGSARDKLVSAEIFLSVGMNQQAYESATAAEAYFASTGQYDSDLRGAYLAAIASKALKQETEYNLLLKKVIDIQGKLKEDWGPDSLHLYLSRPDFHFFTLRTSVRTQ